MIIRVRTRAIMSPVWAAITSVPRFWGQVMLVRQVGRDVARRVMCWTSPTVVSTPGAGDASTPRGTCDDIYNIVSALCTYYTCVSLNMLQRKMQSGVCLSLVSLRRVPMIFVSPTTAAVDRAKMIEPGLLLQAAIFLRMSTIISELASRR